MMPIQMRVTGTGNSTAIIPDFMQNPFNVSIGCVAGTASVTFDVQHCFDYTTVFSPTWNGSSSVTWFNNSGITAATTNVSGNYAFPVAAIRLHVGTAVATSTVDITITQASNAP